MYLQDDFDQCSHILNIYDKQEVKEDSKGNLYLSGVNVLENPKLLQKLKISCVLSIIDDSTYEYYKIGDLLTKAKISENKHIDLQDYQELSIYPHLDEAHTYISSKLKDHNVLVHCQMGMSRSSTLVIAYLMKEFGMDYHKARTLTKSKRKIIQPNVGFENDLKRFEAYLKQHHPELFKK